jgi:glycosyltransferase involved in cell wall biosynthesis
MGKLPPPLQLAHRVMPRVPAFLRQRLRRLRADQVIYLGPVAIARAAFYRYALTRWRQAEETLRRGNAPPDAATGRPDGRRSVLFIHNAYYNFYYLARALRERGWDALSASIEPPDSPHAKFYHGEDVNLHDPDPQRFASNIAEFFHAVPQRFRMVHFYGRAHMSFFPDRFDRHPDYDVVPTDFIQLRQRGVRIGYTVCGCLDGVAQTSVHRWTGGACDKCVWQHNPSICSDLGNLAWGHKVKLFCDLIATETFPALDYQGGANCFREPLTSALDQEFWRPDLPIPDKYRLTREPGELIVYHAVGNFATRSVGGRNLKGTGAVVAAIDRLRAEGMKVRLEFVTDMPNREVRFIQAQADVIVDQLNYGRYGATAREGMMLGKPTICHMNLQEPGPNQDLEALRECPLVSADENTVYAVLKGLLENPERRRAVGAASRKFAVKWHSAEACAGRFEQVYERLMTGQPVAGFS